MQDILGRFYHTSSSKDAAYAIFHPCFVWVLLSNEKQSFKINTGGFFL